jgi:lysophospholipase L1-like esterase
MKRIALLCIISLLLSGCVDISDGFSGRVSEPAAETPSDEEIYKTYAFTALDNDFLAACFYIGDSVFAGLADSEILETRLTERIFAESGASVGNITETRFPSPSGDGYVDILTALVNEPPDDLIILLGTDDVATSNAESFTAGYLKLISLIRTFAPSVSITVLSIPPIVGENAAIIEFNAALKAAVDELRDSGVRYLDLDTELKNARGELKSRYALSDGVSLNTYGLYAILWRVCNT